MLDEVAATEYEIIVFNHGAAYGFTGGAGRRRAVAPLRYRPHQDDGRLGVCAFMSTAGSFEPNAAAEHIRSAHRRRRRVADRPGAG